MILRLKEHLLSSLPSSFRVLVSIINEREDDISIEDTIRKVQQELSIKEQGSVISPNTSAATGQAPYSAHVPKSV